MGHSTWTEAAMRPQKRTIVYKEVFRVNGDLEAIKAIDKRYYEKNRDWIISKKRAYYQKNKELLRAKAREYYRQKKLKQITVESV